MTDFSLAECVESAGLTMMDVGKPPYDPVALAAAEARVAALEAENEARIEADEKALLQELEETSDPGLRRVILRRLEALRDGSYVPGELGAARAALAALRAAAGQETE